jgi:hypothetical protein
MGQNPAAPLIIVVVMVIFTFWFGSLMLKAVDVLYKPSVKHWLHNKSPTTTIWRRKPAVIPGELQYKSNQFHTILPASSSWENSAVHVY